MLLPGKVAIVTGAGSGIGRASALRFAAEGASVVVADVRGPKADETVAMIDAAGGAAVACVVDVADAADAERMVATAVEEFGGLDALFNNAGTIRPGTAVALSPQDWDLVMAVNVRSVFLGVKYAVPVMVERGGGAIVSTASVSGLGGDPANVAYSASKAAVVNLTRSLAVDHARQRIRVNCICPGAIDTPPVGRMLADPEARCSRRAGAPARAHRASRRHRVRGRLAVLGRIGVDHGTRARSSTAGSRHNRTSPGWRTHDQRTSGPSTRPADQRRVGCSTAWWRSRSSTTAGAALEALTDLPPLVPERHADDKGIDGGGGTPDPTQNTRTQRRRPARRRRRQNGTSVSMRAEVGNRTRRSPTLGAAVPGAALGPWEGPGLWGGLVPLAVRLSSALAAVEELPSPARALGGRVRRLPARWQHGGTG